jgi:carboxypeptidase C (cathepsin A)
LTIYSGYLNVKEGDDSAIAYIFYGSMKAKTKEDLASVPTILWFSGGPGDSGFMGSFLEIGPIIVNP